MGQRRPRADTWSCRRAVRRAYAATGNRELMEKYVVPFIQDREAQYIGCWPVTEPQHGSDWVTGQWNRGHNDLAGHVIARRDGDSYVISRQKSAWVSNGTIATHGLVILIADPSRGSVSRQGRCFRAV